jgi:hypothetical protein
MKFYCYYSLPLVILHELSHLFMAILLNVKFNNFKIYKMNHDMYYNGSININVNILNFKKWKICCIILSPVLLILIPTILSLFYNVFIYIILYEISTMFISIKNNIFICLFIPSYSDLKLLNFIRYKKYLIDKLGKAKFNNYKNNNIDFNVIVSINNLLNYSEFIKIYK